MKIGVLGSGKVAKGLGKAWIEKAHEVWLGSRNPISEDNLKWAKDVGPHGQVRSLKEAAQFGEVILLAINPWTQLEGVIQSIKKEIAGKVVIDVSNNIEFSSTPKLAFTDRSLGQAVQQWATDAYVVKTLNHLPVATMIRPKAHGISPAIMWISGDQDKAKSVVASLIRDLGWNEVVDLGNLEKSRLQEVIGLTTSVIITDLFSKQK
jgi:8-hydroxy-5-deazaflavin:NADPH oxidoreductase